MVKGRARRVAPPRRAFRLGRAAVRVVSEATSPTVRVLAFGLVLARGGLGGRVPAPFGLALQKLLAAHDGNKVGRIDQGEWKAFLKANVVTPSASQEATLKKIAIAVDDLGRVVADLAATQRTLADTVARLCAEQGAPHLCSSRDTAPPTGLNPHGVRSSGGMVLGAPPSAPPPSTAAARRRRV